MKRATPPESGSGNAKQRHRLSLRKQRKRIAKARSWPSKAAETGSALERQTHPAVGRDRRVGRVQGQLDPGRLGSRDDAVEHPAQPAPHLPVITISRRYYIPPQVNLLTKHV